jgi:hypothetical protein
VFVKQIKDENYLSLEECSREKGNYMGKKMKFHFFLYTVFSCRKSENESQSKEHTQTHRKPPRPGEDFEGSQHSDRIFLDTAPPIIDKTWG